MLLPQGWNIRTHAVSGVDLAVAESPESGGQKPTLLFLHGGESPILPNARYLELLGAHFKVIAPWHPGFGASSLPRHFSTVSDLALLYLDLADQFALENVVLAGSSLGGWIAMEVAIRNAARFSRLVLLDSLGIKFGGREAREITDLYATHPDELAKKYFFAPEKQQIDFSAMDDAQLTGYARARESIALFGWKPYMHNPQLKHWLHRLKLPTLVIWGQNDGIVSADYGLALSTAIAGSKFASISQAGHFPHIEQPQAVVTHMTDFASAKVTA